MKYLFTSFSICILLFSHVLAQPAFHKNIFPGSSYAGPVSGNDTVTYLAVNYGDTSSAGGIHIIKYDNNDGMLWSRRISDPGIKSITVLKTSADGGCLFGGKYSLSFRDSMYVAKMDKNGTLQWCRNINYRLSSNSLAPTNILRDITEGVLGSDIVLASRYWESNGSNGTGAAFHVITKLNSLGTVIWSKKYMYPYTEEDYLASVTEVENENYVIAGKAWTGGNFALKINDDGDRIWSRYYLTLMTGQGGDWPAGFYMDASHTHYHLFSGSDFNGRIIVTHLDTAGAKTGATMFSSSTIFRARMSCPAADGGVLVGGSDINAGASELFFAKVANDFTTLSWNHSVFEPHLYDGVSGLSMAPTGDYYIAANFDTSTNYYYTYYSGYLARTDNSGNGVFCNSRTLSFTTTTPSFTDAVYPFTDSTITNKLSVINLSPVITTGYYDEAIVQCSTGIAETNGDINFSIYPNPVNSILTIRSSSFHANEIITVSVTNVLGDVLKTEKGSFEKESSLNIKDLAAGIYFVEITSEREKRGGRFVKE